MQRGQLSQQGGRGGTLFTLSAAVLLLSCGTALAAAEEEAEDEEDEEEEVEEMIVTGSFIRRDNFDLPSPMATIDEVDLELAGTPDLGDVIFDQTFQVGVNAYSAPFEFGGGDDQNWQQGGEVWANLRGLGTRATMTMMDGHRVPANVTGYSWWTRRAGTDLTNLYPGIAIGRVETVLDGASALYGSEAVSGVINLIPRKDFEGLMMNYEYEQPLENGAPSTRLGLLAGAQGERTSVIFALEIRDQDRMKLTDRPEYIVSSANWTGQYLPPYNETGRGNPGDWSVPVRGADGALVPYRGDNWHQIDGVWFNEGGSMTGDNQGRVAARRTVDPGCGYAFGAGNANVPMRPALDPNGANPNDTVDDADHVSGLGYTDHRLPGNFLNGFMTGSLRGLSRWEGSEGDNSGSRDDCRQVLSDWQDIREQRDQQQGMAYFEHELNDYVKFRGEIVVSNMDYDTRDIPGNLDEWDGRSLYGNNVPIVVGSNPGNPYRAFADGTGVGGWNAAWNTVNTLDYFDANGNGRYDYLQEPGEYLVFAQDSNGDGIPDRDVDGDGMADPDAQRRPEFRVLLPAIYADADGDGQLDSLADADGDGIPDRFDPDAGIRLFEDVKLMDMTISPKQPYGNTISWLNDDMTYSRRRQIDNLRIRLGTEVNIPDTEWVLDLDWIWATSKREEDYAEPVWPWAVAAMRCQGGQFADQCWNPFSTAWLDSDEDGQILPAWRDPDDPAANTELEHRNAGVLLRHDQRNIGTYILDATISNGSLFNLWYNDSPVGFAAGMHWRIESEEYRPNQLGASALGSARTNFQYTEEETQAVYMEVQLPLIAHPRWGEMEVQAAVRYAEFEGRGDILLPGDAAKFNTTIPKLAIRYQPIEWLAFRGSLTQGFVLPGMFQLFQTTQNPNSFGTVRDYLCDLMPELSDCSDVPQGGGVPNVLLPETRNSALGAEESDLWNAGFSLRFLEGDLSFDVDYTTVDFSGRVERLGAGSNVNVNEISFRPFVEARCPGTLLNYDSVSALAVGAELITPGEFIQTGSPNYSGSVEEELACRLAAAQAYVATEEMGIGGAVLVRGGDGGLRLLEVGNPWLNQGSQTTTTLIYAGRYSFEVGDYGSFELNLSATQMREMSLTRYSADSGHRFAAIKVDGVGNRNNANWSGGVHGGDLFWPLPPTPEWRVDMSLRWFRDNHVAQMRVRWHDELTDVSAAFDEVRDIPGAIDFNGTHNGRPIADWEERDSCSDQDRNPYCNIDSRAYWDASYTYTRPDTLGLGYVAVNMAVRNIFNSNPDPIPSGVGHETYVDNIMGRIGFMRITLGF